MGETRVQVDKSPGGFSMQALLASVGLGSVAGSIAGLVCGGVGGRLAMRVVFLTSDERVRGRISDDGFEIGRFSADTIFLLIFLTILGSMVGAIFGAIRAFAAAPTRVLAPAIAITAAAFGGSQIVHADGIDFRALEPLALTVGLFVLIPGLWGVTTVLLADRLSARLSPPALDTRIGGATGLVGAWVFLSAVTIIGILGLIRDVQALT